MLWLVSFGSTVYITSGCNAQGQCETEPNNILVFAMLLSYYWTAQVINNVLHVTVAGTVSLFVLVPECYKIHYDTLISPTLILVQNRLAHGGLRQWRHDRFVHAE